jgi:hypothetical protein
MLKKALFWTAFAVLYVGCVSVSKTKSATEALRSPKSKSKFADKEAKFKNPHSWR